MVKSPNFKGSSHAQFFGILKKIHIFTRRIVCPLFHDAKFGHTFININKQLNWIVLQYTILCLQSIFSVYLIINTNYCVRYVNIS